MAPRFLSSKTFLIACVAVAMSWASPARASMIFPEPWFSYVTVGDPLPVFVVWNRGPWDPGLESFHAALYYDASILRPQGVRFSSDLGDPDIRSYTFDEASGSFIPDEYGEGDALTIAGYGEHWLFPEASPGQGTITLANWSLIFDELYQPGFMWLATVTFDTLQPGTTALDLSYFMGGDGLYTSTASATVNPVPVPEPSTLFLMLAAAPWALTRMRHSAGRFGEQRRGPMTWLRGELR